MKNILIIGSGLTGCLTAYKAAKLFPKKKIYLLDSSNKILNGFKSEKFGHLRVNNGYHGIDIERNKDFFNFLKKKIKVPLIKIKDERYVIFGESFFKDGLSLKEYPKEIFHKFKLKSYKNESLLNIYKKLPSSYKINIKNISKRYSNNFKDNLRFFIPWFLPKEFELISKDEGDIFRKNVRKNKIKSYIGYPKNFLFENFSKKFIKELNNLKNVDFILNTKFNLNEKKISFTKKDQKIEINYKYLFICTNTPFFLKGVVTLLKKNLMNKKIFTLSLIKAKKLDLKFTEILIANKTNFNFMRLSKINPKNRNYFLLESIFDNKKSIENKLSQEKLNKLFNIIDKKKKLNPKNIMTKITRTIYFPSDIFIKNLRQTTKSEFAKLKKNNKEKSIHGIFNFSPINMSKSWIESEKNIGNLKKVVKRNE